MDHSNIALVHYSDPHCTANVKLCDKNSTGWLGRGGQELKSLRETCNNDPPGAAVSNDDDIDNSVDNSIPEGERANGSQILQHSAAQQHDTAQHHVRPENHFEINMNRSALCSLASKVS